MKVAKLVIRHIQGSKIFQNESFNYNKIQKIAFGRSEASNIKFNTKESKGVSREHAVLKKVNASGQMLIEDLNSLNGVLVNGKRITGSKEISIGDEIQLGFKGPKFIVDIEPKAKKYELSV